MTDKEFKQLFARMQDAPEFGGDPDGSRADAVWAKICDDLGFENTRHNLHAYSFWEYADFCLHTMSQTVLQPMAVGISAFVLVLGGWVATVNASYDTLPGDALYPVKLATERVQLTMATTTSRKAKLHVEFAGRRLQEMTRLEDGGKGMVVNKLVQGFKQEMASASANLSKLQENDSASAVSIAAVLDRRADEYKAVLGQAQQAESDNVQAQDALTDARAAAKETEAAAVQVLVKANELSDNTQTKEDLQKSFQSEVAGLNRRMVLVLARLTVIEAALKDSLQASSAAFSLLRRIQTAVVGNEGDLNQAMNALAAGGYNRAFGLLEGVDQSLTGAEQAAAELEVEISTLDP